MTLAELRLLGEEFGEGGTEELRAAVADGDSLASVASIVDDAVWQPPLGVAAGEAPSNPEWLDVDGREATADVELRALLTEDEYEALRDLVGGL